jgi:2-Cys peroxiredoxin 5
MFAARRVCLVRPAASRLFHSTPRAYVKVGDAVPDVELMEDSPGNKVSLAKELKGNGLIIGTAPRTKLL